MATPTVNTPFSVAGKSAIVTGAGSGINYCFAKLLLEKGCNVLIADLALRPEAQALVDQYSSTDANKPRAIYQPTDVRDWAQLSAIFTRAAAEFGDIDLVVPGAGVFEPRWSSFWHPPGRAESTDSPTGGRYATLDINVTHPIRATQLAVSHFLNPVGPKGTKASAVHPKRVLHVGSVAGQTAGFHNPLYFATKHALAGFVYSMVPMEALFGIRVNSVAPGVIKTPLWTEDPDKMLMVEQNDWATPEEVAEAMLSLVEDDDMPSGTILEVGHNHRRKIPLYNNPGPVEGAALTIDEGGAPAIQALTAVVTEEGWGKF